MTDSSGGEPSCRLRSWIAERTPIRLALRTLVAAGASWLAVAAVGWQPASAAVITGALTWLLLTGSERPGVVITALFRARLAWVQPHSVPGLVRRAGRDRRTPTE